MANQLILFRFLSSLSIILCLIPLGWHIRHRNFPSSFLIFWLTIFNAMTLLNSFIWPTDISLLTGWDGGIFCDIQTKLLICAFTGHLGASAAISRNLARAFSDNIVIVETKSMRRRELTKDILLCCGFPVYMMLVHYIVQPRRYYLLAITGCTPAFDRSWPSFPLLLIWPPISAILAAYYAILVIIRLVKHKTRFSTLLTNSTLTKTRFLRLLFLALSILLILLPVTFYNFVRDARVPLLKYSWNEVHGDGWLEIMRVPTGGRVMYDRWFSVAGGYVVFLLFGFGKEAVEVYRGYVEMVGAGWLLVDRKKEGEGWMGTQESWKSGDEE